MQRLLLASLSALLLSAVVAPTTKAQAQEEQVPPAPIATTGFQAIQLTPEELVGMAYQGYFQGQGISSNGQFISDYRLRKISVRSLIQSAIDTNRLSAATLEDRAYYNAVENVLDLFFVGSFRQ